MMMRYSRVNEPITGETSLSDVVHHPLFGVKLKEQMDRLGIECVVVYRDAETGRLVQHGAPAQDPPDSVGFVMKQFQRARR